MSKDEILAKLVAGEITSDVASKLLDAVPQPARELSCKVSQKGAVSVYGLQQMPVTLYPEQWERLIAFTPRITTFIEAHDAALERKSDSAEVKAKKAKHPERLAAVKRTLESAAKRAAA